MSVDLYAVGGAGVVTFSAPPNVAAFDMPGAVYAINGFESPDEYKAQKGSDTSFATLLYRGAKLIEGIKFTLWLFPANGRGYNGTQSDYADYLDFIKVMRPKRGQRAPTFLVSNPLLNDVSNITRMVMVDPGAPAWDRAKGIWIVTLTYNEDNPTQATKAGAVDAPGTGGGFLADLIAANNAALADQASALVSAIRGPVAGG